MIATWQAPLKDGSTSEELLFAVDKKRPVRILILPALFDEANKLRRFTVQLMRALDQHGIDSYLPDLPGCNESLIPLQSMSLADWRTAASAAQTQLGATHVLSIRGGALLSPEGVSGWSYAPVSGAKLLRSMIRARTIAAREGGRAETSEELMKEGRTQGLVLGGWPIGPEMFRAIETAETREDDAIISITQNDVGGAGLWLRAEPGENPAQVEALAAIIAANEGAVQ